MEKFKAEKQSKEIDLKVKFSKALENKCFNKICKSLGLPQETLMKYTSSIMEASKELENCSRCKGIETCPNLIKGCMMKAERNNNGIVFSYINCEKNKKEPYKKNITYYDLPSKLREASIKEIYNDDASRKDILKKMKAFKDAYLKGEKTKGIYLYGNFGSGKSYILAALFNDLAKYDIKSIVVHTPELILSIKNSFDSDYSERFEEVMKCPLLLLDDIGAEYLTPWARDEVLEPILQYRMDEELPTFFTSNYTMDELEKHFIINDDKMKAKRIIERVKQVSIPVELIGKNRRG